MVYDRRFDDRVLTFEASGALESASLVMRDRETDSWWSIMSGRAIGGALAGRRLEELPVAVKTTWRDWRRAHPDTQVLSVDGRQHVESSSYDDYFTSDRTFRSLEVADHRLDAKEPIFAFRLGGRSYAVPHAAVEGGRRFTLDKDRAVLLYRAPGAPLRSSTRAFLVAADAAGEVAAEDLLTAPAGDISAEPLAGFDTYWYTWIATNSATRLLD